MFQSLNSAKVSESLEYIATEVEGTLEVAPKVFLKLEVKAGIRKVETGQSPEPWNRPGPIDNLVVRLGLKMIVTGIISYQIHQTFSFHNDTTYRQPLTCCIFTCTMNHDITT